MKKIYKVRYYSFSFNCTSCDYFRSKSEVEAFTSEIEYYNGRVLSIDTCNVYEDQPISFYFPCNLEACNEFLSTKNKRTF